ncbi:V-set domain containing T-cell activation inhibitor 1-like [Etheostoma cragini]|uniref:V-set domain containing T-cell activation inhibitor 1-like n=1 Tax=Etheostoma cragini TaxID=417921 RepID=UPI00155E65BA|nr:V-set domain containing T-cell activation inhibitor 1-like [Etheostoma cragini]
MFGGFAKMRGLVLLVSAILLACCAGQASTDGVSVKILTSVGQSVILPCHVRVGVNDDVPSVEWSKEGLKPNIAFLYRDGCETFSEKNPVFNYRTNLIMDDLKNGNLSLRISPVQMSDAGKYTCKAIRGRPRDIVTVELSVGATSEPRLAVVPGAGGVVTLQCEADCWFPIPEITLLDVQGNVLDAEETKTPLDPRTGCYTATRRATLQTANRVTCRVHQPDINKTKYANIYIPDEYIRSCTQNTIIAVVVTILVCGSSSCALTALLCKKCGHSVGGGEIQKSPTHSNVEGHNPGDHGDHSGNVSTEHVMSNLPDSEKIRRLTEEVNHLRSKQCVVYQRGQPTVNNSPSNHSTDVSEPTSPTPDPSPHRNHPKAATSTNGNRPKPVKKESKPAVSIHIPASGPDIQSNRPAPPRDRAAASSAPSDATHVGRSNSMSESRPGPNSSKVQRRYSTSGLSNRFTPLANLSEEDAEPLL